jgi:hypothetical protein
VRAIAFLDAAVMLASFVPGAVADGGGRAEAIAVGGGRLWTTVPDGVVAVDPITGRIEAPSIPSGVLGGGIVTLAADERTLWRLQPHSLVGLTLSTRRVRLRVGLGQGTYSLAAADGAVWLPSFDSDTLTKVGARSGARRWRVRVARSPQAVVAGAGSVWVASVGPWHRGTGDTMVPDGPGIVLRLDPVTGAVRARVRVGRGPLAIAFGAGAVWVLNGRGVGADDSVDRIDAWSNRVAAVIRVPHWSSSLVVGRRYVWVVSSPRSAGGVVTRIDIGTNHRMTRRIPRSWIPAAVAVAAGGVWVADPGVAQLIRIDPGTFRVSKRIKIPVD